MIKKRVKNNDDNKIGVINNSKDNELNNTPIKYNFSDIEIKTFEEKTIEVLNELEKSGVNIYDENRYGGMYLKRNNSNNISPHLVEKFKQSNQTNQEKSINTDLDVNILKNFFNNNK